MIAPTAGTSVTGQMLEEVVARTRVLATHARMVTMHERDIEQLEAKIRQNRSAIADYQRCIREENDEIKSLEYTLKTGHVPHRCTRKGDAGCGGCRSDSGLDCMYDSLTVCTLCGGVEGSLLPTCPKRRLTFAEDQANYMHYCNSTGPFAPRLVTAEDPLCPGECIGNYSDPTSGGRYPCKHRSQS